MPGQELAHARLLARRIPLLRSPTVAADRASPQQPSRGIKPVPQPLHLTEDRHCPDRVDDGLRARVRGDFQLGLGVRVPGMRVVG